MVFCGSRTSSPAVEMASSPMNVKKIVPAAAVMPATPLGAKSAKLSEWNPVNAITTNISRTATLMTTMVALTFADSDAPRIRRIAHIATRISAGRFTNPGSTSQGAADRAVGICQLNRFCRSWFRYPLQPTATAAVETPYSRSRQAATPIATTSPSVAYA